MIARWLDRLVALVSPADTLTDQLDGYRRRIERRAAKQHAILRASGRGPCAPVPARRPSTSSTVTPIRSWRRG